MQQAANRGGKVQGISKPDEDKFIQIAHAYKASISPCSLWQMPF